MSKINSGQVELSDLLFTMSWEDPIADRMALRIAPGDTLITITSGGCNTLSLLLEEPIIVYAVDINPTQSNLLELKIAAIKELNHDTFLEFLGVRPSKVRLYIFENIKQYLSEGARTYWIRNKELIQRGILGMGRYERFVRIFRKILQILQGNKRIDNLFNHSTIEEQREYFDNVWDTRRWRGIFKLFFNKKILARRGLSADYFQFDDGSTSFAESFYRRSKRAMTEIPVGSNYFLSQYLLGRYRSEDIMPPYLLRDNFEIIKSRIERIKIISADLKEWLSIQSENSFDCLSLSNICEVMDIKETNRTFEQVVRTAKPGARICFRNLIVPRKVPDYLSSAIVRNTELSKKLLQIDYSFVYSRIDAYEVYK
jgi:S-adenosylmethionine-diacylglycerol 3-amino-3-carboxypropyl transferase